MLSCRYDSKAKFAVASEIAVPGFEERDVQLFVLLVLVCVFEKMSMVCEIFVSAVMSLAGQHDDMIREGKRAHTFLLSRILLAEGKRGACTFWI